MATAQARASSAALSAAEAMARPARAPSEACEATAVILEVPEDSVTAAVAEDWVTAVAGVIAVDAASAEIEAGEVGEG